VLFLFGIRVYFRAYRYNYVIFSDIQITDKLSGKLIGIRVNRMSVSSGIGGMPLNQLCIRLQMAGAPTPDFS